MFIRTLIVAALLVASLPNVRTHSQSAAPSGRTQAAPSASEALLKRYCITCHNGVMRSGGLLLDQLDVGQPGRDPQTWEKVVRKLRTGMMPPSGAPRPDRATLDRFASVVEDALDHAAAATPNPGAPALHRLNRTEYANAVRDLLDLPVDATALLPGDDSTEGLDNIASALGVSPALMQAYVSAAAKISRLAIGDPTISSGMTTYVAPRGLSQSENREGLPFGTRGGLLVEHVFPLDAEYDFRIGRSGAGFGLPAVGGDEPIEITVDGARMRLLGRDAPRDTRLRILAGPHIVGVAIVRQANARGVDDLFSELATSAGVQNLSITGPFNPTGPGDTPSRRKVFVCRPANGDPSALRQAQGRPEQGRGAAGSGSARASSQAEEGACARRVLSRLASRAFRHPVREDDAAVNTLMAAYESGRDLRGFDTGIQYALARVLVDPQFIFRFEREPANLQDGAVYRVSDLELASRLSFFLWSSVPDDELLTLAGAGRLADPAVLEQQTRRMLADPRAQSLVHNVAGQWLLLRHLEAVSPTAREFDGNLRLSFERETELLFETILREDRSVVDLIDADYTFVDERLARHYGIPNIRGSRFRRVTVEDDTRRGLLGHGSLLTVTSAGNRTSPVKRGKWILENLLGAPVPLPPPGVETNLEATGSAASTSLRQRLEQHRANPTCSSCHAVMDPIGFALENFDQIGKWRDVDGGAPVNASSKLVDGTPLNGPASLRQALIGRREAFVGATTEKLLAYALGRRVEYFDMPAVRTIVRDARQSDYRFSALVVGIVRSLPFQMKMKKQ